METRTPSDPVRTAIVGLGGFASAHHNAMLELESERAAKLVATCDPAINTDRCPDTSKWGFSERGVRVHETLHDILAAHECELELVTLPVPIPLHAPMHATCVGKGLPVFLEKPPTLDPVELEQMIETDRRAAVPTSVGFNFIQDPVRIALKERLLAGEFGELKMVCAEANWPRGDWYYGRARWAGRLMLDGRLVLDGPLGNACIHFAHDALHWCGPTLETWGAIARVRASLLSGHNIQGSDTALVDAEMTDGVRVRLAFTHASREGTEATETLVTSVATIRFVPEQEQRAEILWNDGRKELLTAPRPAWVKGNLATMARLVRSGTGRPHTTLVDSRGAVHLNALAHISAGQVYGLRSAEGILPDIEAVCARFIATGETPVEQGVPWAGEPQWVTPADLGSLSDAVVRLAASRSELS